MRRPLRFGVLCAGSPVVDLTQSSAVQKLLGLGETEFAVVVILGDVPAPSPQSNHLDDLHAKFGAVPHISCSTTRDPAGYRHLTRHEVESVALHQVDVLLDFSAVPLAGEILNVPLHGVWTLVHRVIHELTLSIATLVRVGNPPGTAIPLASCVLHAEQISLRKNRAAAMLAAADLPANVCKDLLSGRACSSPPTESVFSAFERPPLGHRVFSPLNLGLGWTASQLGALLFMETWNVGIVNAPIHRFLEPAYRPDITWMPAVGRHKFIADPFAVDTGNGVELLVEEFDYDRYQGHISSARWMPGQEPEWTPRVDEGVHMSYPFPIRHDGQLYVVPEASLNREVALYRTDSAPGRWQKVGTLIEDFAALDSTLVECDGCWWLFCTCRDDFPDSKLFVWHAPELWGPWQPHRMNPVKCDIRSSRPGGTPFWYEGTLYRPAQDSSRSYGGALTINRVTSLTLDEFREEPAIHLPPIRNTPYPHGWHTLSAAGSITLLDAKRMAFLPRLSARRFRHKLKRLGQLLLRHGAIGER